MANTLKLIGNSIELNRTLSSGDGGVLGPFTIQATQNGMSATAIFYLTVAGAAPTVGPVPLPSPYPLQPGFTPISDASQITGPGNYQLTNDVHGITLTMSNVTLDCAGYSVADSLSTDGQNVVIKNGHLNGGISVGALGSNTTVINNWVVSATPNVLPNRIVASNVTVSNNLFDGFYMSSTDDPLVTVGSSGSPILSNLQIRNNIFQNGYDVGFEGVGGWTQCTIQNNRFHHVVAAMGGWWDIMLSNPSGFHMTYCTFQGNIADAATVSYLYDFNGGSHGFADNDAAATALWGGDGSDGNIVNNNTFSGNIRQ